MEPTLSESQKKQVFRELVSQQDQGLDLTASRAAVAKKFNITLDAVKEIERVGLAKQWPPLK